MAIISLRQAEAAGQIHYFTGKPCAHGHIGLRYVSTTRCVKCTVDRVLRWQVENPEKKKAKQRRYDARLTPQQKLAESRRDRITERQRREARLTELAGRPRPFTCELCKEPNSRRQDIIAFDHCHKTGKFRGWLCDRCNMTIGAAEDSPKLLRAMADYLDSFNARTHQP